MLFWVKNKIGAGRMRYSDRYKTLTVRFKPEEWKLFMKRYRSVIKEAGIDISKHMFIKTLLREALGDTDNAAPQI